MIKIIYLFFKSLVNFDIFFFNSGILSFSLLKIPLIFFSSTKKKPVIIPITILTSVVYKSLSIDLGIKLKKFSFSSSTLYNSLITSSLKNNPLTTKYKITFKINTMILIDLGFNLSSWIKVLAII